MSAPHREPRRTHNPASRTLLSMLVLLGVLGAIGCKATSPTSPNLPTSLDGQNDNETATFNGTLTLFGGGTAVADGATDVVFVVEARDRQGNPVQNFTPVTFATTLGTVRAPGTDPATAGSTVTVTTFGGQAQVLLRSSVPGLAEVTAVIADVVATSFVRFEAPPSTDVITLAFRVGGSETSTVTGISPFLAPIVATVTDQAGTPLAAREVRFRIVANSAGATLTGAVRTQTDGSGEATNVLRATGVGTVSLVADLLDADGSAVAQSNQIIATVTNAGDAFKVKLTFGGSDTTTTAEPGATTGMEVEVLDAETDAPLNGHRVRFVITSDTAVTTPAELAFTTSTLTDGDGKAFNAITAYEDDTRVVIEVQVLADNGQLVARSNQIVLAVVEEETEDDGGP